MRTAADWADEFERRPALAVLKVALIATLIVAAVLGLVGLLTTGSVFFQAEKAEVTRDARQRIIVNDPQRALGDYERFYEDCQAVLRLNAQIVEADRRARDLRGELREFGDDQFGRGRQELSDTRAQASALRDQREQVAAGYNARARQTRSRGQFRAADLPYQVVPPYEEVTCGA